MISSHISRGSRGWLRNEEVGRLRRHCWEFKFMLSSLSIQAWNGHFTHRECAIARRQGKVTIVCVGLRWEDGVCNHRRGCGSLSRANTTSFLVSSSTVESSVRLALKSWDTPSSTRMSGRGDILSTLPYRQLCTDEEVWEHPCESPNNVSCFF